MAGHLSHPHLANHGRRHRRVSSWATRLAVLAAGTVLTLAVGLPILASAQPADSAGGQLNTSKIPLHLVEHIQAAAGTCPQLTAP